jgi:hypothetical protein
MEPAERSGRQREAKKLLPVDLEEFTVHARPPYRPLLAAVLCALPVTGLAQSPTVSVGGVVYTHFVYQLKDSANHVNNFDVTRAYLNVSGKFSHGVKTRVTGDVYRTADGSLAYRLKYAYVSYAPDESPLTFTLGQLSTPLVGYEEGIWGYRMQGTVALDRAGYLSSSDFGIGVDGTWSDHRITMAATLVNGERYNGAPGDQNKDLMGRLSVRLRPTDDAGPSGGLRLTGYAHLGRATNAGVRNRLVGLVSYVARQVSLAAEVAATKDGPVSGRVISAFAVYRLRESTVALIGRVDLVDPNTETPDNGTTRFIAGVSYQLTPNIRVLADVDHLTYQGTPTPAQEAVRSQALLQVQFTF